MTPEQIISLLPYQAPFRFVDAITVVNSNRIEGTYSFRESEFFYAGHFPGFPITPGVILTECMAQIGLVAFGIYLLQEQGMVPDFKGEKLPLFTSSNLHFYKKIFPGDTVTVQAEKIVFRHHKLRVNVKMMNELHELVSEGMLSGMFV